MLTIVSMTQASTSRARLLAATDGAVTFAVAGEDIVVPGRADDAAARRECGLARRVERVVFTSVSGSWTASVIAVWGRLPQTRSVSLPAALALAAAGHTTMVESR